MAFVHPVPRWQGRLPKVSQGFKAGHPGVDILYPRLADDPEGLPTTSPGHYMPNGVPALAFGPGRVKTATQIGTGGYVVLDHVGGLQSQYMHLTNLRVKAGDSVETGDVVGTISHNPSGYRLNHLHFQLRQNGSLVDPETVLKDLPVLDAPGGFLKIAVIGFVVWGGGRLMRWW